LAGKSLLWAALRPHLPRTALSLAAGILLAGSVSVASWFALAGGPTRSPQRVEIVIPPGTAARIASGATDSPIPRDLKLVRGDVLVVRNDDSVDHRFGPFLVPSGQTVSVPQEQAGSSGFLCTFHPSGGLGLTVKNPNNPLWILFPTLILGFPFGAVIAVVWAVFSRLDTGGQPQPGLTA